MSKLGDILGKISGRKGRKSAESDLAYKLRELREGTGAASQGLLDTFNQLLSESQTRFQPLQQARQRSQSDLSAVIQKLKQESVSGRQSLINQLTSGLESAYGQYGTGALGMEDKLRQAITGQLGATRTGLESILGRKEVGIRSELDKYLSGEFRQSLPEIEAVMASRGLSLGGGTASEALGQELSRLGGVRYQTLADLEREREGQSLENLYREANIGQSLEERLFGTGREDLQGMLQSRLGIGQQEAQLTREDQLDYQQNLMNQYLRNLGFSREDERAEQGFQYDLRGQRLPLEQTMQQMRLGQLGQEAQLAQGNLERKRSNEQGFWQGLIGLGTTLGAPYLYNKFPGMNPNKALIDALKGMSSVQTPRYPKGVQSPIYGA